MPYDEAFYALYADYLREYAVRSAHDWVLGLVRDTVPFRNVVDFGCGKHREYLEYAHPTYYFGVDVNAESDYRDDSDFTDVERADYRTMDLTSLSTWSTAFVSLFSTEITAPWWENYEFYNRVFKECPQIHAGLVSGFYYEDRKHEQPIREAGNLTSWQTLEAIHEPNRLNRYTEKRIILPVPSSLFGPDVFEVWKLFERHR
jgi:hypothetical protein